MQIFIDFDDVLFNTAKLIETLKQKFQDVGISEEDFTSSYLDYPRRRKNGKLAVYDIQEHVSFLEKKKQKDFSLLRKNITKLLKDTSVFVFSDSVKFLELFKKEDLYIVSYGESELQRTKINHSGLTVFFRDVIVVSEFKGGIIKQIRKKNDTPPAYFLEDRTEQIDDVKNKNTDVTTFLVKRPEGLYNDRPNKNCDFVVKNLFEASQIILTINS